MFAAAEASMKASLDVCCLNFKLGNCLGVSRQPQTKKLPLGELNIPHCRQQQLWHYPGLIRWCPSQWKAEHLGYEWCPTCLGSFGSTDLISSAQLDRIALDTDVNGRNDR